MLRPCLLQCLPHQAGRCHKQDGNCGRRTRKPDLPASASIPPVGSCPWLEAVSRLQASGPSSNTQSRSLTRRSVSRPESSPAAGQQAVRSVRAASSIAAVLARVKHGDAISRKATVIGEQGSQTCQSQLPIPPVGPCPWPEAVSPAALWSQYTAAMLHSSPPEAGAVPSFSAASRSRPAASSLSNAGARAGAGRCAASLPCSWSAQRDK